MTEYNSNRSVVGMVYCPQCNTIPGYGCTVSSCTQPHEDTISIAAKCTQCGYKVTATVKHDESVDIYKLIKNLWNVRF